MKTLPSQKKFVAPAKEEDVVLKEGHNLPPPEVAVSESESSGAPVSTPLGEARSRAPGFYAPAPATDLQA